MSEKHGYSDPLTYISDRASKSPQQHVRAVATFFESTYRPIQEDYGGYYNVPNSLTKTVGTIRDKLHWGKGAQNSTRGQSAADVYKATWAIRGQEMTGIDVHDSYRAIPPETWDISEEYAQLGTDNFLYRVAQEGYDPDLGDNHTALEATRMSLALSDHLGRFHPDHQNAIKDELNLPTHGNVRKAFMAGTFDTLKLETALELTIITGAGLLTAAGAGGVAHTASGLDLFALYDGAFWGANIAFGLHQASMLRRLGINQNTWATAAHGLMSIARPSYNDPDSKERIRVSNLIGILGVCGVEALKDGLYHALPYLDQLIDPGFAPPEWGDKFFTNATVLAIAMLGLRALANQTYVIPKAEKVLAEKNHM